MDQKYLERRRQTWYVKLRVPPSLVPAVGKHHIIRSLRTRDLNEARRLRWAEVGRIKGYLEAVRDRVERSGAPSEPAAAELRELRELIRLGETDKETEGGLMVNPVSERVDQIIDGYMRRKGIKGDPSSLELEDELRAALLSVNRPHAEMLRATIRDYLAEIESTVRASTAALKHKRIHAFAEWLGADRELSSITKAQAGKYITERLMKQGLAVRTVKFIIGDLHAFFGWCEGRGMIDANPFTGQSKWIRESSRGTKAKRRAWTADELVGLLEGLDKPTDAYLRDLAIVALYTGMRIDEICETECDDVHATHIHIPEGKTASSVRDVPLHPVIRPLVKRLKEQSTDGFLFSGLKRGGRDKKRSHYASRRFGDRKRALGFTDETIVFHSLRKNMTTALEEAGVPLDTAKLITGHSRRDITYGLYSTGVSQKVLAEAVSKVSHGKKVDPLVASLVK